MGEPLLVGFRLLSFPWLVFLRHGAAQVVKVKPRRPKHRPLDKVSAGFWR